jgi:methionine-rich copper-binding protein CopC
VGVKFRAGQSGSITGIRFYKGVQNTGTHVGSLWTSTGTRLGTATFSGESASGWQQASFATPIQITADTTYVASYTAPAGRYAVNENYFTAAATTAGPLTALREGTDGSNGVYASSAGAFPSSTYRSSNYWVDVAFMPASSTPDTTPPTVTAVLPTDGATDVAAGSTVRATFSEAVTSTSITMSLTGPSGPIAGTRTYDPATRSVTFSPASALAGSTTYTASVSGGQDAAGNTMLPVTWVFTTAAPPPADTTPPTVTGRTPAVGATGVSTGSTVTTTFSEALQAGTAVVGLAGPSGAVAGATSYNATTRTVTFTPAAALAGTTTYTATVSGAKDVAGNTMSPVTWTFTTAAPPSSGCPCTLWPSTATPAVIADPDNGAVELGVKFRTTQAGRVTAIRFYKGAANTGTHTGSLWNAAGTRLGTVTFTGESASGWQQATFAAPIAVSANTTYVASYFAPVGRYSVNENYFTSATTRGPLTALQNGTDGANGVYRYGASGFPNSSYASSNYWVDVVLATD